MPRFCDLKCSRRGVCFTGVGLLMLVLLLPMLMVLTGCKDAANVPAFTVYNRTGKQLGHLVITDAGPVLNYPKLANGEEMTRRIPRATELPRVINVYWQDYEGRHLHQKIELWKRVNSDYKGAVKLTLERSGNIRVNKTSIS